MYGKHVFVILFCALIMVSVYISILNREDIQQRINTELSYTDEVKAVLLSKKRDIAVDGGYNYIYSYRPTGSEVDYYITYNEDTADAEVKDKLYVSTTDPTKVSDSKTKEVDKMMLVINDEAFMIAIILCGIFITAFWWCTYITKTINTE